MIANVLVQSATVPANGNYPINQTGSKLMFISNTGTFNFSIDGGRRTNSSRIKKQNK